MRGLDKAKVIRHVTLKIRSRRVGGLEAALRYLKQGNIDVVVLQETELTERIHAWQRYGYAVWEIVA